MVSLGLWEAEKKQFIYEKSLLYSFNKALWEGAGGGAKSMHFSREGFPWLKAGLEGLDGLIVDEHR